MQTLQMRGYLLAYLGFTERLVYQASMFDRTTISVERGAPSSLLQNEHASVNYIHRSNCRAVTGNHTWVLLRGLAAI